MRAARHVAALRDQVGKARVYRARALGADRLARDGDEAALAETIAFAVGDQDARRDQLVERAEHAALIAVVGQQRVVGERERIAVSETERLAQLARLLRHARQARAERRRQRARQIGVVELARQRPAAGLVAREPAI